VVKLPSSSNASLGLAVLEEGRDKWKRRYFRFAKDGVPLAPVLVQTISSNRTAFLEALNEAGANVYNAKARRELGDALQHY
jgi:hypothetical protein